MTHTELLTFDGFASSNNTQIPDELFDTLMTQLTDCEPRAQLYIVRRMFGFKTVWLPGLSACRIW